MASNHLSDTSFSRTNDDGFSIVGISVSAVSIKLSPFVIELRTAHISSIHAQM